LRTDLQEGLRSEVRGLTGFQTCCWRLG
jgi:hypothetical protein